MSQGNTDSSSRAPKEDTTHPSTTNEIEGAQEPDLKKIPDPSASDTNTESTSVDAAALSSGQQQAPPPIENTSEGVNGRLNGHAIEQPERVVNGTSGEEAGAVDEDGSGTEALDSSQGSNEGDGEYSSDNYEADLRRVKVYELIGSRWTDRGTAFCSGVFDDATQEAKLIARSEANSETIILNCAIRANDVYQRQQETLIVWTEPDGTDFALSFQDVEGCTEVWEFIFEVQRHLGARGTPDFDNLDGPGLLESDADELFTSSSSLSGSAQPSVTTLEIIRSGRLPQPEVGIIGEIEKAIRALARTPKARENISVYIQDNNYIHSLVEIFRASERTEDLDTLHALCSCMQTILLLNEHQMYEHILADDLWMDVVGMLEYDPEFPKYKANYREFLLQRTKFLQPVSIDDLSIQRKIHHTYRLQYLKDVILGRALDDSTFNVLNSCIIFNQIDIINHVQHDERFLNDLLALFVRRQVEPKGKEKEREANGDLAMDVDKPTVNGSPTSADSNGPASKENPGSPEPGPMPRPVDDIDTRRKEVILLLQQLCQIGKNVQLPARIALFRTLVERGVLYALQWALCRSETADRPLVSTAGEILAVLLDHHTASVRGHILLQAATLGQPTGMKDEENDKSKAKAAGPDKVKEIATPINGVTPPFKETILQVLCRLLPNSDDLAVQSQLAEALRMLLEVPQGDGTSDAHMTVSAKVLPRQNKDDPSLERFLDNFYKVSVESLFRPITTEVPEHQEFDKSPPFSPSREKGNLYLYLCDLLCNFAIQHSFRSFFFVLSSKISARIATLLNVRDKHLCLAALRFFRICLKMNNSNLFRHLDKVDIYSPIINLTVRESKRNNLLSSTCQEFFDTIRKENLKEPIMHIMKQHEAVIKELGQKNQFGGAGVFCALNLRYEMHKEGPPKEEETKPSLLGLANQPPARGIDAEEEDYFLSGKDDDDDDSIVPVPRLANFVSLPRRKRLRVNVPSGSTQNQFRPVPSHQRPESPLSSLLEYDDDDDVISPLLQQASSSKGDVTTPDSPVLPHRQIQLLEYDPSTESDPEDDALEEIVSRREASTSSSSRSTTPIPSAGKPSLDELPIRSREKRQRDEDEEDEGLERLVTKNRRLSNASLDESKFRPVGAKINDEAPKKLKLRFGASKVPASETIPFASASSKPDAKDSEKG